MRRARFFAALSTFVTLVLIFAPTAMAGVRDHGGEGWYGETTDPVITNMMFITIAFFPCVIILFSLIQWYLDKRKHARMDAEAARTQSADWRGGW
jgi:ATP/ADP translocase